MNSNYTNAINSRNFMLERDRNNQFKELTALNNKIQNDTALSQQVRTFLEKVIMNKMTDDNRYVVDPAYKFNITQDRLNRLYYIPQYSNEEKAKEIIENIGATFAYIDKTNDENRFTPGYRKMTDDSQFEDFRIWRPLTRTPIIYKPESYVDENNKRRGVGELRRVGGTRRFKKRSHRRKSHRRRRSQRRRH